MSTITLIRAATLIALALAWEALGRSGLVYNDVVPPLTSILAAAASQLLSPTFYWHFAVTAFEVISAFLIAASIGIPLGLAFGVRRYLGAAAEPYVSALATTPKIVFLPIVMIAVGIGISSKITVGALSAVFPIILATASGVRGVRPVLIKVGRAFNLTTAQMVQKVYLPALTLPIITGMRLGLGVAIIGVLLGEIKLSNAGLGFLANDHYNQFRIADLYAVILLVFVMAGLANAAMSRFEAKRHRQA